MFKCGEKCTGILAAKGRLVREEICYDNAQKEDDKRGMERAARKMRNTTDYIKLMNEWPPAVHLAIGPALLIARLTPPERQTAVMAQVKRAQETRINPMNWRRLDNTGVTGKIIRYLIAKHDRKEFVPEKRFLLTPENANILNYLKGTCRDNPTATKFLNSLLAVA